MDYISEILNYIQEKNYDKITDMIRKKNDDLLENLNENKRIKMNEINVTIFSINNEIEKLGNSLNEIKSNSESSDRAKEIIINYIKNLRKEKSKLIMQKKHYNSN